MQLENASLIHSLRETNLDLMQSRREKEELENFYQRQTETTDKIMSRLRRENQKVRVHPLLLFIIIFYTHILINKYLPCFDIQFDHVSLFSVLWNGNHSNRIYLVIVFFSFQQDKVSDLIFQKRYMMLENQALKERYRIQKTR